MAAVTPLATGSTQTEPARTHKISTIARRETFWGYLFISPFLIGLFVFTLIPTVATFVLSFTNYTLSGAATRAVGLLNYQNLISDAQIWAALLITLKFALIALPVGLVLPLMLAVM